MKTLLAVLLLSVAVMPGFAQTDDSIAVLVGRLDLEKYKATIKGLTQFGDRRQGTDRNRMAVDWIEAQLKSYGCPTDRIHYEYTTPPAGQGRGRGQRGADEAQGGGRLRGIRTRTGVNTDPMKQPDERIRALDAERDEPGERQEVFCTKVGTTHPEEMYIIGGHMDGHGFNEAANDYGSGTALVMELARIFSMPDVTTDVTIRFALWNGEEGGLRGATAYVAQRQKLQGQPDEPKWLGMIQHDMMMFDHGMPRADGTLSPDQRPEADFNIEWQSTAQQAEAAMKLALTFKLAADKYSKNYPGTLGPHMTNTDSGPFMNIIPAISLRENERGMDTGAGWNPHWHQPTDLYKTFSDKDFLLGLNSAQTTLAAIAQLTGAKTK